MRERLGPAFDQHRLLIRCQLDHARRAVGIAEAREHFSADPKIGMPALRTFGRIGQRQREAAKLPDGDAVRAWIEANTELSPEAFTDTAFAQRERAGQVEALRYLCTPEWLIRLVLALTAAKLKVLGLFGAPRARDA